VIFIKPTMGDTLVEEFYEERLEDKGGSIAEIVSNGIALVVSYSDSQGVTIIYGNEHISLYNEEIYKREENFRKF
jgi:hypothetical protein